MVTVKSKNRSRIFSYIS